MGLLDGKQVALRPLVSEPHLQALHDVFATRMGPRTSYGALDHAHYDFFLMGKRCLVVRTAVRGPHVLGATYFRAGL